MANHVGSEGTVRLGANTIAELEGWSLDTTSGTVDDTELGDTWMTKKPTTKGFSGSINCFWDETDSSGQGAMTEGAELTLNLYPEGAVSGDTYYSGSIIITGIGRSGAREDIITASYSFEGNGALSTLTVA